jgi:hypothetical protein
MTIPIQLTYFPINPAEDEDHCIELTIASVISQTIHPLQCLIVSDGSTVSL